MGVDLTNPSPAFNAGLGAGQGLYDASIRGQKDAYTQAALEDAYRKQQMDLMLQEKAMLPMALQQRAEAIAKLPVYNEEAISNIYGHGANRLNSSDAANGVALKIGAQTEADQRIVQGLEYLRNMVTQPKTPGPQMGDINGYRKGFEDGRKGILPLNPSSFQLQAPGAAPSQPLSLPMKGEPQRMPQGLSLNQGAALDAVGTVQSANGEIPLYEAPASVVTASPIDPEPQLKTVQTPDGPIVVQVPSAQAQPRRTAAPNLLNDDTFLRMYNGMVGQGLTPEMTAKGMNDAMQSRATLEMAAAKLNSQRATNEAQISSEMKKVANQQLIELEKAIANMGDGQQRRDAEAVATAIRAALSLYGDDHRPPRSSGSTKDPNRDVVVADIKQFNNKASAVVAAYAKKLKGKENLSPDVAKLLAGENPLTSGELRDEMLRILETAKQYPDLYNTFRAKYQQFIKGATGVEQAPKTKSAVTPKAVPTPSKTPAPSSGKMYNGKAVKQYKYSPDGKQTKIFFVDSNIQPVVVDGIIK